MKTTVTSQQVINLITRSFDAYGYLLNPKSRKNQKEAKMILDSELSYYGETVNGLDAHNCLLIIAYPDKEI